MIRWAATVSTSPPTGSPRSRPPRTRESLVVVIVAVSAVPVESWIDEADAVLQTFYSGMEGGAARARLLFGEVSPSGRLLFSVAGDSRYYAILNNDADEIDFGRLQG